VDTLLLGRVTYQYWAPYWPSFPSDGPDAAYAAFINETPKYVVSTTLDDVRWGAFDNVRLIRDDLVGQIAALKARPGKDISVQGSPGLVNSLLQCDLLDELTLYVHNVVAYRGKRLFTEGSLKRLDLVEAKPTRSGVVIATYRPRVA
jgi:dihydrofolate reductase